MQKKSSTRSSNNNKKKVSPKVKEPEGILGALHKSIDTLKKYWEEHKELIITHWANGTVAWRTKVLSVSTDVAHTKTGNSLVDISWENLEKVCPEVGANQIQCLIQKPASLRPYFERIINSTDKSDAKFLKLIASTDPKSDKITFYMRGWVFYFDGSVEGRAEGSKTEQQEMIENIPVAFIIQRRQFLFHFLNTFVLIVSTLKPQLQQIDKKGQELKLQAIERKNETLWFPNQDSILRVRVKSGVFLNLLPTRYLDSIIDTSNTCKRELINLWTKYGREFRNKWSLWPPQIRESEFKLFIHQMSTLDYEIFDGNTHILYGIVVPELDPQLLSESDENIVSLIFSAMEDKIMQTEPQKDKELYNLLKEFARKANWPPQIGIEASVLRDEIFPYIRQIVICRVLNTFVQSVLDDYDEYGNLDQERALHSLLAKRFGGDTEAMKKAIEQLEKGMIKNNNLIHM